MNKLRGIVYIALVLIVIANAYLFIRFESLLGSNDQELKIKEQAVKNTAIQECFKAATVTTKEGNLEKTEPVFYIYMLCLQDKGYTTNFK